MIKTLTAKSKKNYIRAMLVARDISLSDIARELNVSVAAVSQVISGKITSYRIQKRISELLNVPFYELWPKSSESMIAKGKEKGNVKLQ